jgi:predicted nucleic acid-binding protein
MLRKLKFSNSEIREFIKSCYTRYDIINFSEEVFIVASEIREHYNISYYDSLIVST